MYSLTEFLLAEISNSNFLTKFGLSIGLSLMLFLLVVTGRRLEPAIRLERLGVPLAVLFGLIGIILGPYGLIPLFNEQLIDFWIQLPTPLLTIVFSTLMLGRPLPNGSNLWKPVASQTLMGLLLGFGQYLFGGLVVFYFLIPLLNVDPLMGCLIEVGFEGGHGAAAVMGESFKSLGFISGLDLGLSMATIGLLSSTLIGSGLVVFARWKGWISFPELTSHEEEESLADSENTFLEQIEILLVNFGLIGTSIALGVLMLYCLRQISPALGPLWGKVFLVFPVFPLALLGALLIRFLLEKTKKVAFVSELLQREIGTLATDLLIVTAMASLNLDLLKENWLPITVLSIVGLIWNLIGMAFFAKYAFIEEKFERSITEFGNATGVAASGLLLLRLSDPSNLTKTLSIFSIKQLLLQPLLSGGLVTVLAPIAISQFGLFGWTEICGAFTAIFITLSLLLKNYSLSSESASI